MAAPVSQMRVWWTLCLGYLASNILDAGLTPDRVQICTAQLHVWSSQLQSRLLFSFFFCSYLNRILTFWFSASCRFWQFQLVFCVFAGLMGEYFDQPARSSSWDIRQGLIGHDAPALPWLYHGHSGYGGEYGVGYGVLEGYRKEDVTSKASDPPFTNLTPRSNIDEKPMLIGWLSGGGDAH